MILFYPFQLLSALLSKKEHAEVLRFNPNVNTRPGAYTPCQAEDLKATIEPPKTYAQILKENAQRSKVKHVRFFCYVPDKETGKTNRQGAFFSVGLGPCGRFVDNLDVHWTDHLLTIRQRSQDAEFHGEAETKVFLYPLKDIEGRIEILE